LGKPYGIKFRCYWERLREQLGKEEEKQKITCPTPPPKGENRAHYECMLSLPIGCTTIFDLGYLQGQNFEDISAPIINWEYVLFCFILIS
jgi:hypothetical protein